MNFPAAIVVSALFCLVSSAAVAGTPLNIATKSNTATKATAAAKPKTADKPQSASTKQVHAVELNQYHIYLGKTKVLLTPSAIKIVGLGKFHFTLVSKAPEWNVTAYREDDKLYCTQPLGDFYDQGLFSNLVFVQKERMAARGFKPSKDTLSGFAIKRYKWANVVLRCLPLRGIAAPPAERILYAAYKVPTDGQIPISFEVVLTGNDWMTHLSEEGMHRAFLKTQKISKRSVAASEFDIPAGFAKEKSMTRIVIGDAKQMKDSGVGVLFDTEIKKKP